MLPSEVLEEAKKLISSPHSWIKGANAAKVVDGKHRFCANDDKEAKCFCATGAVYRVSRPNVQSRMAAYDFLALSVEENQRLSIGRVQDFDFPWRLIVRYNDHHAVAHIDVMAMFDRAIAMAKVSEQEG